MIADYGFLLELETSRGVQLNFFPFFLWLGSVTRPKSRICLKGMDTPLRRCSYRFSVGPLDFVL